MADTAIINDVSDMISMVPSDLFADVTDTSNDEPEIDDTPVDDEPEGDTDDSIEAPETDEDDEPEAGEKIEDDVAPVPAAAKPEETEDELPEGVRKGKDRKGKDGYFLEQNRYKTFHENHKLAQAGAEILGEPMTAEAIKVRNDAYHAQERLYDHLTGGDPKNQSEVVSFMLGEMKTARDSGETGVDPTVSFADSVYDSMREHSPDGHAQFRLRSAQDFIGEMFELAAQTNNDHLFNSAQHISMAVTGVGPKPADMSEAEYIAKIRDVAGRMGIPFHVPAEKQGLVKKAAPTLTADQKRIKELESQLGNASKPQDAAAQFSSWQKGSTTEVNKAVLDDAVLPALATVVEGWKPFPDDYKRLVTDPLNREVVAEVKADPVLTRQVSDLIARARRATSEQVRTRIAADIRQLYVNRAKLAAEKVKGPILKFAAETLKGRSDQTHERRNGAQARTAPKGPSAPVRTSVVPQDAGFKNNIFDPKAAAQMAARAIRGA